MAMSLGEAAYGERGMVATVHREATAAGIKAMQEGGNAIDAAVAAGLTLGVVDGFNSGIGGGCFLVIRLADGTVVAIDGRETAPLAASRNMYLRAGRADVRLSQAGPLAAAVPGALAAYHHAAANYGKLPFQRHLLSAAQMAEDGFFIGAGYAARLREAARDLKRFPAARELFLQPDGKPKRAGDLLKQSDLAATYRAIAEQGVDWFYHGPFAQTTAEWMQKNGGLLNEMDFARYTVTRREPIETTYRGFKIIGFPPPSSGGVHVAEILNILENFDLKAMGAGSAEAIHVMAEAMKLAFADRAYWLGDPDFAQVPRGLLSKEYAANLARQIDRSHASRVAGHNTPERAAEDFFRKHTTHFSTADAEGNWVACTATINTTFGSKVVIAGTGVVLNNQMDDFSAQPGVANYFGLIGAEANAIAPGKRPLSSMSPTLVLKEGRPVLSLGAAGGPTIISQTLLTIVNLIDFGMDLEQALAQARFHHQWRPDKLVIEKGVGEPVRRELRRRGHKLKVVHSLGATQAVARQPGAKGFVGAHDPRVKGKAEGW
ncbi:MAG: gamma-glutamyltransferase [Chloroflexi bacterium]|nr:gamma-glutamyltransferase [Chloroflexota bacterium]